MTRRTGSIALIATLLCVCLPLGAWASNQRSQLLVEPQWVQKAMEETDGKAPWLVAEVSWGSGKEYAKGHIPGAIHVNTDEIEYDFFKPRASTLEQELGRSTTMEQDLAKGLTPEKTLPRNFWNLYPDSMLLPALANMGITRSSRVIVYSHDPSAAARLAWTLLYVGVSDMRIVNGGLTAWSEAGLPVSTKAAKRTPIPTFGSTTPSHPEYLASIKEMRDVVSGRNTKAVVADVRTEQEHEGITAPYSYIPTKGRIRGSVWVEAGTGPWTMEGYVDSKGRWKNPQEVAAMWKKHGITGEKTPYFYCGTGWRSSLAFLYAWMLGWDEAKNFDAGWYTWSMGPELDENPVAASEG